MSTAGHKAVYCYTDEWTRQVLTLHPTKKPWIHIRLSDSGSLKRSVFEMELRENLMYSALLFPLQYFWATVLPLHLVCGMNILQITFFELLFAPLSYRGSFTYAMSGAWCFEIVAPICFWQRSYYHVSIHQIHSRSSKKHKERNNTPVWKQCGSS